MGFHRTSKETAWGDTPAEILEEAFEAINQSFQDSLGRPVSKGDLLLGCYYAIWSRFPPKRMKIKYPVCKDRRDFYIDDPDRDRQMNPEMKKTYR